MIINFAEWMPDQTDFGSPGSATVQNAIPLTKDGNGAVTYGPMPTPQVYSSALTARCQGAYAFLDDSSGVHIFAGDATKLYQLTAGSAPAFSDVSRTVGGAYTTGSPVHPLIPTAPSWCFTSFGVRVIATNYSDAVQSFVVGSSTNFAALSAGAPKARFAAVVKDFLMLGNTSDPIDGVQTRRAWWSGIGDPTNWPTLGSNTAISVQSDAQDLEQSDLGQMTGLAGGHLSAADGAAFMERGIYRMQYVGSAGGIFAFQVAEGASGTQSPLSLISARFKNTAVVFYVSTDGLRAFDGMSSVAFADQKFDRTVMDDIDPTMLSMVQGGRVPNRPLIYWLYTSKSGASSTLYDKLVIYNTQIDAGALVDLSASPAEWGLIAMGTGFTLDALDAFGTLDTLPAPLDSNYWQGGTMVLAAFDSDHKLNFVNGPAMAPTIETAEIQPTPGRRSKILSARSLATRLV